MKHNNGLQLPVEEGCRALPWTVAGAFRRFFNPGIYLAVFPVILSISSVQSEDVIPTTNPSSEYRNIDDFISDEECDSCEEPDEEFVEESTSQNESARSRTSYEASASPNNP